MVLSLGKAPLHSECLCRRS